MDKKTISALIVFAILAGAIWFFSYRGSSIEVVQEASKKDIQETRNEIRKEPEEVKVPSTDSTGPPAGESFDSAQDEREMEVEYKKVMTTLFWVGEEADESNAFISNSKSAWDKNWMENYGGVDDPNDRCGFKPCGFEPKENPFYFALPYNDLGERGKRKDSAELIWWFDEEKESVSVVKNRWIEVKYQNSTCYGQWEDVGPLETDDFEYVFGSSPFKNEFGVGAGLDVSPALWDCLGLATNSNTEWKFIAPEDVPNGPWSEIITTSDVSR